MAYCINNLKLVANIFVILSCVIHEVKAATTGDQTSQQSGHDRKIQLFTAASHNDHLLSTSPPSDHNASALNGATNFGYSRRLTEHLIAQHNPNTPPDGIVDVRHCQVYQCLVDVHYELELVHILGIDELKQTFTALVYIDQRWRDQTLAWDPAKFGGLRKTWLPMNNVWLPDVLVFNMLEHEDLISSVRAPVVVESDGSVECSHPAVYTVTCAINIKDFPLDEQICSIEIASWAYSDEKIRLHAHVEHSLEHYAPNEEWFLVNVTVAEREYEHEGINVSEIRFQVAVRRKPLFYMVTVTFPSYVMCAISIVGLYARFSTNTERQERFSLGVTAILTSAVLSLVVSEKVPHSSSAVPLLVAYFLFNMVVISIAAMTTGLVMGVHRLGRYGKEPPRWLMYLFLVFPSKTTHHRWHQQQRRHSGVGKDESNHNPTATSNHLKKRVSLVAERRSFDAEDSSSSSSANLESEKCEHNGVANGGTLAANCPPFAPMEDIQQRHVNLAMMADSALRRKLTEFELRFDKLHHHWRKSSRASAVGCEADSTTRAFYTHLRLKERNGWVCIAQRLDWIFMCLFLTLLTIPVVYLFSSI